MIDYLKSHFFRNFITLLIVGGLCYWSYFKDAGNIWVWLFIPIVLISFFVPFFERKAVDKETNMMMDNGKIKDESKRS